MKVNERLRISALLTAVTVFIIVGMLFLALYRISNAVDASEITDDIIAGALERVALRNDYAHNDNERARVQWVAKHEQIGGLLNVASKHFRDPEDKKTVDHMVMSHESIGKIFAGIVENREKTRVQAISAGLAHDTEDRLISQMNMKSYAVIVHARKLLESSRETLFAAIRLAGWSIFLALAILLTLSVANFRIMGRAITDRVRRLREGALVIGGGDLDHRIDVRGDDEFAELSGSFNAMTAKLRGSYQDLEREIEVRTQAEEELRKLSEDMAARNVELEAANRELESFVYSVSHDLRAPLRHVSGFAKILVEDCAGLLDKQGMDCVGRIRSGSAKMTRLIDDLLYLSRVSRQDMIKTRVDLSTMAASVISDLRESQPDRPVQVTIRQGISAFADPRLMELALRNLLGNSWKFTSRTENASIEFGILEGGDNRPGRRASEPAEYASQETAGRSSAEGLVYFVRDNGAGFTQDYAEKMFLPFHRLHSEGDFEGTGIGLSIVERIIRRHGGRVWAEGEPGKGAAVYFTLL